MKRKIDIDLTAIIRANLTTWPRTIAWGLLWAIGAASWIVLGSMWA